jgi:hypothetical protein
MVERWMPCTDEEYARVVANRKRVNSNYHLQYDWYVNDLTIHCASQEFLDEQYDILCKLATPDTILPPRSLVADQTFTVDWFVNKK